MVEVGQLELAGTINTSDIEQGFIRIEGKLKVVDSQAKQTNASLSKMAQTGKFLATTLGAIGVAGATAMTSLATKSPVMADTMAKIDVSLLKLSNTIGRQLEPAFQGFNTLINNFNSFLGGGMGGDSDSIFKGAIAGGGAGAIAGGIIGFMVGGPGGIMVGASLGATLGAGLGAVTAVSEDIYKESSVAREDPSFQTMLSKSSDTDLGMSTKVSLAGVDMVEYVFSFFGDIIRSVTEKDTKLTTANGVSR